MEYKYLGKFNPLKNDMVSIMDQNGEILNKRLMPDITPETLIEAYKLMSLSRRQDDYQNKQQRLGRILSFLSSTGQEAGEVAYAMQIKKGTDWFLSGYRNNAAWLTVGMPMHNIMMYWAGNERGGIAPEGINSLPPNIVIGTQYSHATGIAFAEKYHKKPGVVLTTTGDGGSSQGEVYEAMNFAKLHEVPVIFVIENNKYAISTPVSKATKAQNFAIKGIATGIPGIRVDGNDFLASYGVFKEAFEWVREGNGPILVEVDTYRLGAHSSSDNPKIYRPDEELAEWLPKDPLVRLKKYLLSQGLWDDTKQLTMETEQDKFIEEEFAIALKNKDYDLKEIFAYMYSEMTPDLEKQYEEAVAFHNAHPEMKEVHH
ncbi:pyruvate dehydrogenase E1 component alpha subunit [Entomoplasma freundtii]|uniref:Pyruvate dehydrogenase E1 component subunit alpha n=1 Tax=Entomoplasma freundtii TaxID=74700 RepID=A0A2K8NR20_9MOLU|nr:pyruvate dehydrogenase (acetyl-transferring) E1 component subunit alpha [Entomoplasma freundtii]ATZ16234.1 pyruvate dehydrogenase E1 component subunit alpha [Entomoplasma freundtii]TDY56865.1 pyruvate dehydrogenase E1 component alpha subunit [Entomoplasma freundtii]